MKLLVLITSKTESGLTVANAWREAGAPGVTIINSHGLYTLQERVTHGSVELPLTAATSMASAMAYVLREMEHTNNVIISLAPSEKIDELVKVTEEILGDLTTPYTGVFFVLDVERHIGVRDHGSTDSA